MGGVYPEGFLATYGVPEVFGYHGNQLRWYNALTRFDVRQSARTAADAGAILARLSQQWSAAGPRGAIRPSARPGRIAGLPLTGRDQRVAVYANDGAVPGVAVVPEVQVEPDSTRRLALLWSPTFDPSKTVLVEQPVQVVGQAGGTGTAMIEGNGDDTLAVRARSTGPALLTVSRTYHRSWTAEIDGVAAPVIRANHALMAVPLTRSGDHRVVMRYRPKVVQVAARFTAATWIIVLLVTAAAAALGLRQRRG